MSLKDATASSLKGTAFALSPRVGTGARPTLQALPDDLRPGFEAEFRRRLAEAYPAHEYGVVLPFRRVFVVAEVAASRASTSSPRRPRSRS